MRRTSVALIPIVVSLAFAACTGDRDTTAPRYLAPTQAMSADLTLACDFNTMNQDAKNYFPSRDPVFDLISTMKAAFRTSRAAATPTGFDILARVAEARHAGAEIGTAALGGKFVLDVVGCMDVGAVPDKFVPASALLNGVFEIRGNDESAAAATAQNASPNTAATPAVPLWGAEPNAAWFRSTALAPYGRYLIYGYPLGAGAGTDGFELGTLPASVSTTFPSPELGFRVGLCVSPKLDDLTANRLIHHGAIVAHPEETLDQGTHFCSGPLAAASWRSTSLLATIMHKAISLLAPKALSAQRDDYYGIGGLPDGWSPFDPNPLPGSSVQLIYLQQPTNDTVNTNITPAVAVKAVTVNLPHDTLVVPGVTITISITGNNGFPDDIRGNVATTGTDGVATFPSLQLTKAGGYTLTAVGDLSGVKTQAVISNLFNVKNR